MGWSRVSSIATWSVLSVLSVVSLLSLAAQGAPLATGEPGDVEVPVRCLKLAEDSDVVVCRGVDAKAAPNSVDSEGPVKSTEGAPRQSRGLLHCRKLCAGKVGFLAGLHLGGAISSSGTLSASHSLNVFGKVMNTALSVSYGPNGFYQPPGFVPVVRPPLPAVVPILGDDPGSTSAPSTDKGQEAAAVMAGTLSKSGGNEPPDRRTTAAASGAAGAAGAAGGTREDEQPQNRLPVAEDIGSETPVKVKDAAPPREEVEEEVIGEEPEPPAVQAGQGLQLSAQRRANLEAVARVRTPTVNEQRRLFLDQHNKHVATFNRHLTKYNGDVSRVAVFSRS